MKSRLPRAATKTAVMLEYDHIGRTVLINEDTSSGAWIEGLSQGICPLKEIDPWIDAGLQYDKVQLNSK